MKLAWLRHKRVRACCIVIGAAGLLTSLILAFPFYLSVPEKLGEKLLSRAVYARDGTWLASVPYEDYYRQEPLAENEPIPELVEKALLSAEDKRFHSHFGIDPLALARAVRDNASEGRVRSGASTISMQLAKIMLAHDGRSMKAKFHEALLARRIEMSMEKDEILRAYLNHADFGQLCRGIETAARFYFNKKSSELAIHEAALLIAQLRSPTYYNPFKHPKRAMEARNAILRRMGEGGDLDAIPLGLNPPSRSNFPHLCREAGTLTIDTLLQQEVQLIVAEEIAKLQRRNVSQGAVIVVDNETGEILASVPSANRHDPRGGQIDATQQDRSAGSTLKPFVYLLALRAGKHPASIYADLPTPFPDSTGVEAPSNFNNNFLGPIPMRIALASSQNIPALLALNSHGQAPALTKLLHELGYDFPDEEYGLGLAIGNAHVSLLEQAQAFSVLARGGSSIPISMYFSDNKKETKQIIDPQHAYQLSKMLSDDEARTAGFGYAGSLRFPFPCAVKTGTSSNFRDNWCIGYSTRYTVAVWVGNMDQSPMKEVSGLVGSAPIFKRVMNFLHGYSAAKSFGDPEKLGLKAIEIDTRTGFTAPANSPYKRKEWLTENQLKHINTTKRLYDEKGRALLPIEYRSWYVQQGAEKRQQYIIASQQQLERNPRVHMPADGTVISLDPSEPSYGRQIPLKSNLHPERTEWQSDSLRVYKQNGQWYADLVEGEHRIDAFDSGTGSHTHTNIRVIQYD